uniref:Uncharacterized protein n=1 Tax=Anguilla anguilla TaxID=7936 RepID=A0A0E9SW27_ANGAN
MGEMGGSVVQWVMGRQCIIMGKELVLYPKDHNPRLDTAIGPLSRVLNLHCFNINGCNVNM